MRNIFKGDMDMTESNLVFECIQFLGQYGAAYRCNCGSVKLSNGRRFNGLPAGFSDILVILPGGRVAFVECKTAGGKTSPEQERFIKCMQELGAAAGVACSVKEAAAICGIT
jgi:hypothetical protein